MRDEQHYRQLLDHSPTASVGFALAASAIYSALYGQCEPEDHDNENWREIARVIKCEWGETMSTSELRSEMDKAVRIRKANQT